MTTPTHAPETNLLATTRPDPATLQDGNLDREMAADMDSVFQQAAAWESVVHTLTYLIPGWHSAATTGEKAAVATIGRLHAEWKRAEEIEARERALSMVELAALRAENERLRRMMDTLPQTLDGKRVPPYASVWLDTSDLGPDSDIPNIGIVEAIVGCDTENGGFDMGEDVGGVPWAATFDRPITGGGTAYFAVPVDWCFSTRAACEAAIEAAIRAKGGAA